MESYLQGTARDVRSVVEGLGVENISPSTVSRMAKELDAAHFYGGYAEIEPWAHCRGRMEGGVCHRNRLIEPAPTRLGSWRSSRYREGRKDYCKIHVLSGTDSLMTLAVRTGGTMA